MGVPAHPMHWRSDGERFYAHVLTIHHRIIQSRRLAGEDGTGRLVAEWNTRAARRKIANVALNIQDLNHDAWIAVCIDDTHRQLTWPVRWSSRQIRQHIQHSDAGLSAYCAVHARINGIGREEQEQERKETQGHGNE